MNQRTPAPARFRAALNKERPLQVAGAVNAYAAMLAERSGFRALYVSGAGVANASFGLPDLGLTSLENVLEDVRRIGGATDLPLLVDIDTGWASVAHTVREMEKAGVAAVHLEDQVATKRCGHRPHKALVTKAEMADRIRAAVDARVDETFVIMARTDAAGPEGLESAIDRALTYVEAGADMIFAEALTSLEHFRRFTGAMKVPVLANMTEFGQTPLHTARELGEAGVRIVLYPLSAFRAMSAAAARVYDAIREEGTQQAVVATMQTRDELYDVLGYLDYEAKLDERIAKEGQHGDD